MIFGKSGLQGLPTRLAFPLRDIQIRLSKVQKKGATGVPLFTIWDSVAGPGRTPKINAQHTLPRWNAIATQSIGLVPFQAQGILMLPVAEEQSRTHGNQSG
jgi:hypothetical protein